MHAWEQVQKTIDYLENHLNEEVDIESLANMASLSPYYYQRLFHRLVKRPVAEYVKLRRMAKATEALLNKDQRILDIALNLGFTSHEHFSRIFKETFKITPDEYRKNPVALNRMTKPELILKYTLIDEGVPLITEGIVIEINRKQLDEPLSFLGLSKLMPVQFTEGLGTDSGVDPLDALWQTVHEKKETELKDYVEVEEMGVTYPCEKEGYFSYFAGAKKKDGQDVKKIASDAKTCCENECEEYITWELPRGEYIVCTFEAENFEGLVMDALYKAEQYIYNAWLPNHKLQTEAFCAERYASHTPETKSMEIWLKIVS